MLEDSSSYTLAINVTALRATFQSIVHRQTAVCLPARSQPFGLQPEGCPLHSGSINSYHCQASAWHFGAGPLCGISNRRRRCTSCYLQRRKSSFVITRTLARLTETGTYEERVRITAVSAKGLFSSPKHIVMRICAARYFLSGMDLQEFEKLHMWQAFTGAVLSLFVKYGHLSICQTSDSSGANI